MTQSPVPFDELVELVDQSASPLGFVPSQLPEGTDAARVSAWRSDFAWLVLCLVANPAQFGEEEKEAAGILLDLQRTQPTGHAERIDSYLLLAVPTVLEENQSIDARRLELDPFFWRKQVLAPDAKGDWLPAVERAIALALPKTPSLSPPGNPPELSDEAKRLIDLLETDSAAGAARWVEKNAPKEASSEA